MTQQQLQLENPTLAEINPSPIKPSVICPNCGVMWRVAEEAEHPLSNSGEHCRGCIGEIAYADRMLMDYAKQVWLGKIATPSPAFPQQRRESEDPETFMDALYDCIKANCYDDYLRWLMENY